jgi:hypothetical protein
MIKFVNFFAVFLLFSIAIQAQDKWEDLTFSAWDGRVEQDSPLLFPNPTVMGQDVFIFISTGGASDWWVVVRDQSGREVKGIGTTREGGRIRVHGQVPKPGIYLVTIGQGSNQTCLRWVVS